MKTPQRIVMQSEFGKVSQILLGIVSASFCNSRPLSLLVVLSWPRRLPDGQYQKSNRSELSFARHFKSVDAKTDLRFRWNGTSHTPY
jgi:hypothetical protein